MMKTIYSYLQDKSQLIEIELERLIPTLDVPYHSIFDSARYSVLAGGKRLRPVLALATCEMLGGNLEHTLVPACCLELIHTSSLIHDDLPCMDDDDFRRGKPSLHKKFGESQAVLTGDYLLGYSFELLAQAPYLTSDQRIKLISTLAQRSGAHGLIGGQVLDLLYERQKVSLDQLYQLHFLKTASLITASVEFGGIIANATQAEMQVIQQFAMDIGLVFQITDDILDANDSQSASSDLLKEKMTFVTLLGIEESKKHAWDFYEKAIGFLDRLDRETTFLRDIAQFIIERIEVRNP